MYILLLPFKLIELIVIFLWKVTQHCLNSFFKLIEYVFKGIIHLADYLIDAFFKFDLHLIEELFKSLIHGIENGARATGRGIFYLYDIFDDIPIILINFILSLLHLILPPDRVKK